MAQYRISLQMIRNSSVCLLMLWCVWLVPVMAEPLLQPYVLSSNARGDMVKVVIELKEGLVAGGFELLGEYAPEADRHVIVVTNDYLRNLAVAESNALFAVPQRIGITRVDGRVQVAYTNPVYQKYAYRIKGDLEPVRLQLKRILGAQKTFGSAAGLTMEKLSRYQHAVGTEQFDDFLELGDFGTQAKALEVLKQGLESGRGGVVAVFQIPIPGERTSLFGVALESGMGSDRAVIETVDIRPLKHTPRFPSLLVVRRGKVYTLHPRFSLPLDFPDLERTGRYSFTRLIRAPGAIQASLHSLLYGP